MKIAFEAPIGNTKLALANSDYIFAIAPMLKIPEYAEAVREAQKEGKDLYIDNGVYEGQLMATEEYLELCLGWKPKVVVAPDVLGDDKKTLELSRKFFRLLNEEPPFEIMVVPQGKDDHARGQCLAHLRQDWDIDIVGLGLGAFEKDWRKRIHFLGRIPNVRRIHVLGIVHIHDLCFWKGIAETADTSLPFHLGQEWKLTHGKKETKHLDWDDTLYPDREDLALRNIFALREALANVT